MLTSKCVTELGRLFRFFHLLTLCPYEWNEETKTLRTTRSRWRLALWRFHAAFFVTSTVYTSAAFVARALARSFNSTTDLIFHCIFTASGNSFLLGSLSCLLYVSEMEELVNQVLKMDTMLTVQYKSAMMGETTRDRLGSMMPMVIPWVLENVGLLMAVYTVDPDNPRLLGYVLRPLGWPVYPVRMLLEFLVNLQMYYMIVVYWILCFAVFSLVTNHWTRVIARQGKHDSRLLIPARQREIDLKTYKQLQVLNALYNNCLSNLAWPSFILCNLTCHCLCIYIAVKLYDQVPVYIAVLFSSWAVGWLVIDFVIFPHMGRTQELSLEYLYRLSGRVQRSKFDRAVLKSLRPMGIKVGYLFTMDRTTVLMVIVIVSNLTINALLLV